MCIRDRLKALRGNRAGVDQASSANAVDKVGAVGLIIFVLRIIGRQIDDQSSFEEAVLQPLSLIHI